MSIFGFFTRNRSAPVARERLQILLAHERALTGRADLAAVLQEEILAVIAKHISIDREKVNVKLDRGKQFSTLEIDIEMPEALPAALGEAPASPAKDAAKDAALAPNAQS